MIKVQIGDMVRAIISRRKGQAGTGSAGARIVIGKVFHFDKRKTFVEWKGGCYHSPESEAGWWVFLDPRLSPEEYEGHGIVLEIVTEKCDHYARLINSDEQEKIFNDISNLM